MKDDVIQLLAKREILDYPRFEVNNPEEKYICSIAAVLKMKNRIYADSFLKDFGDILSEKKLPLFSLDNISKIYFVWLINKGFCKNILYLAQHLRKDALVDEKLWEIILKESTNYNSQEMYAIFNILQRILRVNNDCIPTKTITELFKMQFVRKELPNDVVEIQKYVSKKFNIFFNIIKNYPLNDDEIMHILYQHFRRFSCIYNIQNKYKKEFLSFLKVILGQNIKYIFSLSFLSLEKVFYIYQVKPEFFKGLKIPIGNKLYMHENITEHLNTQSFEMSGVFFQKYLSLDENEKPLFWYALNGGSIRKYNDLPITITKKGTFQFLKTRKTDYGTTLTEAIVIAEFESRGISHEFARNASKLLRFKDKNINNYYFEQFISLYNKGLDEFYVEGVFDYMRNHNFYENKNRKFKNKTLNHIMIDVDAWHESLNIINELRYCRRKNFPYPENIKEKSFEFQNNTFLFKPLKNDKALYIEGRTMHHCVFTYRNNCMLHDEIIYSLQQQILPNRYERLLTIEVHKNRIIQIRGKYNRRATEEEMEVIKHWADESSFRIAV